METVDVGRLFYDDLLYFVMYTEYQYYIDYKVYEIFESYDSNGKLLCTKYNPVLVDDSCWPTYNIEKACVVLSGSIKWDGCSNWNFNNESDLHFCSQKQGVELGFLLGRLYDHAAETLKTWNNSKMELPSQKDVTRYIGVADFYGDSQ